MSILIEDFGKLPGGAKASLYTLENTAGMTVSLCDYGARIVRLLVPDGSGGRVDVVLGHDSVTPYIDADDCLGAVCGRFANRLSDAAFTLNGKRCSITVNDGVNALHGGVNGFHRKLWQAEALDDGLRFHYTAVDGEEGFPGNLSADITYRLDGNNVLSLEYALFSDADTVVNLTNHAYFNLAGHDSGCMQAQLLQINADYYTPSDAALLPTGEIRHVDGTPFDFRAAKPIALDIDAEDVQLSNGGGYDHNFVLCKPERGALSFAARATEPVSGRAMEVWTTLPGIQLYTANALKRQAGKGGAVYDRRCAYCLETQFFPDSMRHTHFPSPILSAEKSFASRTEFRFL